MRKPNIIWITLESVRQDHTTMGGNRGDTTPNLQEISRMNKAIAFDYCYSHSNWTPPASASMLTGLYPSNHGVTRKGNEEVSVLDTEINTLPKLLSKKGYQTALFSPNPYLSSSTNLTRGFNDVLRVDLGNIPIRNLVRYAMNINKYGPGIKTNKYKHNRTWITVDMVKDYLKNISSPFFLYVHVNAPHHPYTPPKLFQNIENRSEMKDAIEFSLQLYGGDLENVRHHIANRINFTTDQMEKLRELYDSEISFADWATFQIFNQVCSMDNDTVAVITGDHGELFGEDGMLGHRVVLNESILNVPAIVYGLQNIDALDPSQYIQHADIREMILSDLGIEDDTDGIDPRLENRECYISQRGFSDIEVYEKYNSNFNTDKYHNKNATYIKDEQGSITASAEKYDFGHADCRAPSQQIREKLNQITWKRKTKQAEFSKEAESRLEDLGYK